jgi:hypothetical protein
MPYKDKEAKRAYQKAYRLANKEQKKAYYETNKERISAQQKAYYEASKESIRETQRVYYDTVTSPYRSLIDVPDGYDVHHLNHDHSDNRRSNLLAMSHADHTAYHNYMRHGNYDLASQIIYNYEVF